eukprot:9472061-Pyramimonas_sp.AAC.1
MLPRHVTARAETAPALARTRSRAAVAAAVHPNHRRRLRTVILYDMRTFGATRQGRGKEPNNGSRSPPNQRRRRW